MLQHSWEGMAKQMKLVAWNGELTDGLGRSGTRYRLSYEHAAGTTARGLWRIDADDAVICALESIDQAVLHAEALEALRCMARGLNAQLSDEQLQSADVVAGEMLRAAKAALRAASGAAQSELLRSARSLDFLGDAISEERARRQQEGDRSPLPLPN
jgi:hypothetical protein